MKNVINRLQFHNVLTWLRIGSVLIWHIYVPLSFLWTLDTCNFHVLCPLCVTLSRELWATRCVWMARIAFESDLIHATCKQQQSNHHDLGTFLPKYIWQAKCLRTCISPLMGYQVFYAKGLAQMLFIWQT